MPRSVFPQRRRGCHSEPGSGWSRRRSREEEDSVKRKENGEKRKVGGIKKKKISGEGKKDDVNERRNNGERNEGI